MSSPRGTPGRARPRSRFDSVLAQMSDDERRAVYDMMRDELARGWAPNASDLAALLEVARRRRDRDRGGA
ncbi:hypothetical protein [Nocardioides plantarum]|uniref:Uncharacterized protein n=1 Tax=Nocardioides plantarum TaxID=29299 RepID=A0ABV5K7T4_9ACTN|nr:hypothetical protein [Nocardioides plantarum]